MRTVVIFKSGNNRAVRLPRDLDFEGVNVIREGDIIILRPVKPSWNSFSQQEKTDSDFLTKRLDIVEERHVKL
ncbi:type II toxin-antitoxin system VapB family antitoxin [Photorhabdus caribbeanensis]|uniref:type II toxin-antitoxin system VapB family antitoxin n=1 Tax=Photorhabdus caribbeanensis TaxID=1004165 RepID=UPI001BD27917|nr:type II toxin-antitoxin system VapB family antitoxin [Photorhabdus caribbeanensis]MBS9425891.1 AbrB/MazE/SpoVT family DNA-binding domain-containing protein [Photorhabdus caribbeanensis]